MPTLHTPVFYPTSSFDSSSSIAPTPLSTQAYLDQLSRQHIALSKAAETLESTPDNDSPCDEASEKRVEELRKKLVKIIGKCNDGLNQDKWMEIRFLTRLQCTAGRDGRYMTVTTEDLPADETEPQWILPDTEEEWVQWEQKRAKERDEKKKAAAKKVNDWYPVVSKRRRTTNTKAGADSESPLFGHAPSLSTPPATVPDVTSQSSLKRPRELSNTDATLKASITPSERPSKRSRELTPPAQIQSTDRVPTLLELLASDKKSKSISPKQHKRVKPDRQQSPSPQEKHRADVSIQVSKSLLVADVPALDTTDKVYISLPDHIPPVSHEQHPESGWEGIKKPSSPAKSFSSLASSHTSSTSSSSHAPDPGLVPLGEAKQDVDVFDVDNFDPPFASTQFTSTPTKRTAQPKRSPNNEIKSAGSFGGLAFNSQALDVEGAVDDIDRFLEDDLSLPTDDEGN